MKNAYISKNYILIIVLFLSFLSFSNSLSSPKFIENTFEEEAYNPIFFYDDYQDNRSQSDNTTTDDNKSKEPNDIITLINFSYPVFLCLALYMICVICKYENTEALRSGIWLFMYLSNNGYIVVSLGVGIIDGFDDMTLYFLIPELVILGIGTIVYIYKLGKGLCNNVMQTYFSFDAIGFLFKLPCICVWSLIGLTDPCCEQTTYTVTTYEDGHTESNECCVRTMNCIVYFLKRLAMVVTTIIYYIFVILLTIVLIILMLILMLIIFIALSTCCKDKVSDEHPSTEKDNLITNTQNNSTNINEIPNQQAPNAVELNVNYDQANQNSEQLDNNIPNQNVNNMPYPNLGGDPYQGVNNMPYQNANDVPMSDVPQNYNY